MNIPFSCKPGAIHSLALSPISLQQWPPFLMDLQGSLPRADVGRGTKHSHATILPPFLVGSGHRVPINPSTIDAIREARLSSGSRMVWMTPIVVPLLVTFGILGVITYLQANNAIEHTRRHHRPYGILGPAINEFMKDSAVPVRDEAENSDRKQTKGIDSAHA
jgi:hypothetical protein